MVRAEQQGLVPEAEVGPLALPWRGAAWLALTAACAVVGCASSGGEFPNLAGSVQSSSEFERQNELWSAVTLDAARCGATAGEVGALARVRAKAASAQLEAQRRGRVSGASQALANSMVEMLFEGSDRPPPTTERCNRIRSWLPMVLRRAETLPG
jgi:hypothetical protein